MMLTVGIQALAGKDPPESQMPQDSADRGGKIEANIYLLYSNRVSDPFMCLADFDFYADAHRKMREAYEDRERWNRMALVNIAKAGYFSSDRSIKEYADNIWHIKPNR